MSPLTKEELKSYQDTKACHICGKIIFKKKILIKMLIKIIEKVRHNCNFTGKYSGAAHRICYLQFNVPNEIAIGFHNGSNYDHHLIIKEFQDYKKCLENVYLQKKKIHSDSLKEDQKGIVKR